MRTVANALNQVTRYDYNDLGQLIRIARPFSTNGTSDVQYQYDAYGRRIREIDPLGVINATGYDDMDLPRVITEAVGLPEQRSRASTYDLNGNLTSIAYSDGTNTLTTFYDYDLLNRRIAIRGARELPKQFEYGDNDNLVAEINGRGYRTEFHYDAYNRVTNTVEGIGHGELGESGGGVEKTNFTRPKWLASRSSTRKTGVGLKIFRSKSWRAESGKWIGSVKKPIRSVSPSHFKF